MKVKIISIGDELLIGQVIDTNASFIASALNELGIRTIKKVTIPDDEQVMTETLDRERKNVDAVLITGGLGPTKDDKTKDVLTRYFDDHLVLHQETLDKIEKYFNSIDKRVTRDNRNQAMVPSKCRVLYNKYGTAPGMLFEDNGQVIVSMPGVPVEMKFIMRNEVMPFLESRKGEDAISSRTYITVNIPESILSDRLSGFEEKLHSSLKLAYLPHLNMVRLRLNAQSTSVDKNQELLDKYEKELRNELGDDIIWAGDLKMEQIIGKLLSAAGKTITVAESCTGGYVSHRITSVPGASEYFPGSIVTYSYDIKTTQLQVDSDLLWNVGAVSEEVVQKMASSARLKFEADYAIAISGIAGPGGGTEEKPVGTVWMAVHSQKNKIARVYHFHGDRPQIIERSTISALNLLRELIIEEVPGILEKANP